MMRGVFLLLLSPQVLAWEHIESCRDYVESYWDNGKRTITTKYDDSVALWDGPENHIFTVVDRGNRVRNPNLKTRRIVCQTYDGQKFKLSEYPPEEETQDFGPP